MRTRGRRPKARRAQGSPHPEDLFLCKNGFKSGLQELVRLGLRGLELLLVSLRDFHQIGAGGHAEHLVGVPGMTVVIKQDIELFALICGETFILKVLLITGVAVASGTGGLIRGFLQNSSRRSFVPPLHLQLGGFLAVSTPPSKKPEYEEKQNGDIKN